MIFGLFLAWQTKHVSIDVLNDSRVIGFAVYNVCAVGVAGVVSAFALQGSQYQHLTFIVTSSCIIVCTTTSLLVIFLPKVT